MTGLFTPLTFLSMIFGLTFTDNISVTTGLVICGTVMTIYVTVRGGGPWKSLAEGYKQERDESHEREKALIARVAVLESAPDYHEIAESVASIVILLTHMQETQGLISSSAKLTSDAVEKHSKAATARYERLARLLQDRDPGSRTRTTDKEESP